MLAKLRIGDDGNGLYSYEGGITFRNEGRRRLICVPQILDHILYDAHDAPVAGHRGIDATLERVGHTYYWPHMNKTVRRYIATCDVCQLCS